MGDFYINDTACANFIDFIDLDLKDQVNKAKVKANAKDKFFSALSVGSTDSSLIENKIICCFYFHQSLIDSDSVEVKCSFLSLKFLKDLSSDDIHTAISDSIQKKLSCLDFICK